MYFLLYFCALKCPLVADYFKICAIISIFDAMIRYFYEDTDFQFKPKSLTKQWLKTVAASEMKKIGNINVIFCSDNYILDVNIRYLSHDYFTDIITFDYSRPLRISGDMFISLDTVRSNAALFNKDYNEELLRVVIHGVLHLCGVNDKGPGEREIMERHENVALSMFFNLNLE